MAIFKLPLSGDVNQWTNPITTWFSGNQISVDLGESGSPETEVKILRRFGTYGRQLGQITDALVVLLNHLPEDLNFSGQEGDALDAVKDMANDIARIKENHKLETVRPRKKVEAVS